MPNGIFGILAEGGRRDPLVPLFGFQSAGGGIDLHLLVLERSLTAASLSAPPDAACTFCRSACAASSDLRGWRGAGSFLGSGMVMSISFTGARGGERLTEIFRITDRENGENFGVETFFGDPQDIGAGDRRDGLLIPEDEVVRIAEVVVDQQAVERLRGRIEVEDKAVHHGLFCGLEFFGGDSAVRIFSTSCWKTLNGV